MLLDLWPLLWAPEEPEVEEPILLAPVRRKRRRRPEPVSGTAVLEAAIVTTAVATMRFRGEAVVTVSAGETAGRGVVRNWREEEELVALLSDEAIF